jgi:hypothetical protein
MHPLKTIQTRLQDLTDVLKAARDLNDQIDNMLDGFQLNLSHLNSANLEMERKLSAEASLMALQAGAADPETPKKKKFNVTGTTKLRWLLDSGSPTFKKVDEALADTYRKKLLQHYHPDRLDTGNAEMFSLVQAAYGEANFELLALLYHAITLGDGSGTPAPLTEEDLDTYEGRVTERLAIARASFTFELYRLVKTGNVELARVMAQKRVDTVGKLTSIATLRQN